MNKQILNFLQDRKGNNSSKRLAAFIILIPVMIAAMVVIGVGIFHKIADEEIIIKIFECCFFAIGGLLISGVAENWRRKDDN